MDGGTDNGFTFTSPNWPSDPTEKIFRITSNMPNHPANSFYYPDLNDLPPIATFFFVKVMLEASQKATHLVDYLKLFT